MAFIISTYNKYDIWDRTHSVYKFEVNGNWYAIKKVEMEWGLPQDGYRVDQNNYLKQYQVYDTYENALKFARQMKMMNAR